MILRWIQDNCPILCTCGHWCKSKDVRICLTTWGVWVRLCRVCYEEKIDCTRRPG